MDDEANRGTPDLVLPDRRFDLRAAFLLRQQQLLATLGFGRGAGGHPVAVGDSSELNWRGMLESILPARYRVSKAFVVDADGNRSDQIDLLIYDRHFSPVLIDVGEFLYVPAEAAYAAIEVKQETNRETITYAGGKVASVRELRRTSAPVPYAAGTYEAREPAQILGGLVSMDCGWSVGLAGHLRHALASLPTGAGLDLGCALQAGSYEVAREGGDEPNISHGDTALIFFVLSLLKRLQSMATVPAIVFDDYASVLSGDLRVRGDG
jgi:uncharacterized protein DUF6602